MLAIRLPSEVENLLEALAQAIGRTRGHLRPLKVPSEPDEWP